MKAFLKGFLVGLPIAFIDMVLFSLLIMVWGNVA